MDAILVVMGNGLWLALKARSETLVWEVPKGVIVLEFPGNPVSVCSVNGFTPLSCKVNVPNSDGEGDEQVSCTLLLLEVTLSQSHNH